MSKTITVRRPVKEAVELANELPHDVYKAIKHMDKISLAAYLDRIYSKGYSDGLTAARADEKGHVSEQGTDQSAEE